MSSTRYFGAFYSALGVPTPYAGRVRGPVTIRFSKNIQFTLREIKVINYPKSLVLIGTDLLGPNTGDGNTFAYVGFNPASKVGELVFAARGGAVMEVCELVLWPNATCVMKAS